MTLPALISRLASLETYLRGLRSAYQADLRLGGGEYRQKKLSEIDEYLEALKDVRERIRRSMAKRCAAQSPERSQVAETGKEICGHCGQPGVDKVPHPIRWPGEQDPGTDYIHAECEERECARAHRLLSDKERAEFLRTL